MENVMMMNNGFAELSEVEMYDVDGGWSWSNFGIGIIAGIVAGAVIGAAVGAVASVALIGVAGYYLSSLAIGAIVGTGVGEIVGGIVGGVTGGLKD